MDTLQHNNESSEEFRTLPQDSEGFGTLPKASERKENHILTVHITARRFEESGVPRTERSITNWCQPDRNGVSRLDCYFDANERKYYITPQSVERAIEEEKSKSKAGELPHVSESFGNVPNPSEAFRNVLHHSESTRSNQPQHEQEQTEKSDLQSDQLKELDDLRVEKRVWEREKKFYEAWFATLEKERATVIPQIADLNKSVGYLEAKTEHLEKENQRLLTTPMQHTPRIIEQMPHSGNTNIQDEQQGEISDIDVTPENTEDVGSEAQTGNAIP